MNLSAEGHGDWDVLGPTPDLGMSCISDEGLVLVFQIAVQLGKRKPPTHIPLKDIIVYLRGSLGIPLLPIEIVKMMISLGIPLYDDFLNVNAMIGVPISPEEIVQVKQALKITVYDFPLEISMPIRITDSLFDFMGEIWTVKKSKKRLKKIKEQLESMNTT